MICRFGLRKTASLGEIVCCFTVQEQARSSELSTYLEYNNFRPNGEAKMAKIKV